MIAQNNLRCLWKICNGFIGSEGRCIMCGRTTDIEREEVIYQEQTEKKHHNWHGNNPPMWKRGKRKNDDKR